MTSIAEQTLEQLGGRGSVLVRQRRDHIEVDGLLEQLQLEQLQQTAGTEQDEALTRVWRLVFRHAYAEETVLWPVIRHVLPSGEELTWQIEREHQEINELAAALDRRSPTADDRSELIDRLIVLLRQDVRDEEDVLLPRLREALDPARLRRLGRTWDTVRRAAPTRPHPTVSRRPPGNVVAAVPLSLLDHSRDGLDRAARAGSRPVQVTATVLSRVLAAVAGTVERLGPMRHGEHADTRAGRRPVEAR
jgi:hemerythrin-like domain-containing protein